jgi:hypothetical protein
MACKAVKGPLCEHLFSEPETSVFALVDGASVEGLLDRLYEDRPEYFCLWRGELAPDMAEVAPYLVELGPESAFTQWVLEKGWGNHWGIFAVSHDYLRALRQHFRRFTMVYDPDGKPLYFRFYDPRVLRVFLPTCTAEEIEEFFGPVLFYALEDEDDGRMLRFWKKPEGLKREEFDVPRE